MSRYQQILSKSKKVDTKFLSLNEAGLGEIKIKFSIPKNHLQYKHFKYYTYCSLPLETLPSVKMYRESLNPIFLVDMNVIKIKFVTDFLKNKSKVYILPPIESKIKTQNYLDNFIKLNSITENSLIIVIGGGILCNCGAYIAEKTNSNYFLFPTTITSMADGALGGKVRANFVAKNKYFKHNYKSFYEPRMVFFDGRFLEHLPLKEKRAGIVEIIKHGLFQSENLYKYIFDNYKFIFSDNLIIQKAIFWVADLKRVCLEEDPNETKNGSAIILRGGHDFSDSLEEKNRLNIPHGFAVSVGIIGQLRKEKNEVLLRKANLIFDKFNIPKEISELKLLK